MSILYILISIIVGASIYRLRGWGPPEPEPAPWWKARPILQASFALPYAITAFSVADLWVGFAVWVLTTGAVLTGHASIIDLGSVKDGAANMPSDGRRDEWYTRWIPGRGYWHDFAGLMISGMLITASGGLAVAYFDSLVLGGLILLAGALKAPAYAIGWLIYTWTPIRPNEIGEMLTGALLWGSLAILIS